MTTAKSDDFGQDDGEGDASDSADPGSGDAASYRREKVEATGDETEEGEGDAAEGRERSARRRCRDGRPRGRRGAASGPRGLNVPPAGVPAVRHRSNEPVEAEELCDTAELERLRGYLDKQLSPLQGVVAGSPTACSAG